MAGAAVRAVRVSAPALLAFGLAGLGAGVVSDGDEGGSALAGWRVSGRGAVLRRAVGAAGGYRWVVSWRGRRWAGFPGGEPVISGAGASSWPFRARLRTNGPVGVGSGLNPRCSGGLRL